MGARHLLILQTLSLQEIRRLFRLAKELKKSRRPRPLLAHRNLGLLFEKPSLRTRVSFEVGIHQLGGHALYLGPLELGGGNREAAKDLAQVLSRYMDGLVVRTFAHSQVVELAQWSKIPVINGLSDLAHPCQALSDLFTVEEHFGKTKGIRMAYVGDGNNVCHSLIEACALLGVDLRVASPKGYSPRGEILRWASRQMRASGGKLTWTSRPAEAVRGAQVIYTDVWTSMGQEAQARHRKKAFRGFQVNAALLRQASQGAIFLHCLPAHRGEEVTSQVLDGPSSMVYTQAENRLHVQKAILVWLLQTK